jgi:endonuclease/exonuclease/phosphatase family metal-dependent hydrolase
MKIVTYNIQFGLGKDGRFDLERIASEVAGADIIVLQEVERYWQRSGNVDQPLLLGNILDTYFWAYGPYFDVDASTSFEDGRVKNVRRQFGNMILSKTPILTTRLFPLPKSAIRHRRNMVAGVFEGVIELQNRPALRIYAAHLSARSPRDRVAQISTIRKIIRRSPTEGGAWTGPDADAMSKVHGNSLWMEDSTPPPMPEQFVLLGDFNIESTDPEYDHQVGPKDRELGRIFSKEEFVDTWVATGHSEDEGCTYVEQTSAGESRDMRIDFAFVDESMQSSVLNAWIDDDAQGSDHQPYWITLDDAPHN